MVPHFDIFASDTVSNVETGASPYSSVDFDSISIRLASPEEIIADSYGAVLTPDTINYRTFKPEKDGLFCAKIFGPVQDYQCLCGKYKRRKYQGIKCEKCEVEVISSSVRRERMGHINLVYPVVNVLYFRTVSSKIANLLDVPLKTLELVLSFDKWIVYDTGNTTLDRFQVLSDSEYSQAIKIFGVSGFKAEMGAMGIKLSLESLDLENEKESCLKALEAKKISEINRKLISKRLGLISGLLKSKISPSWMVMTVLPVLPPELRPLVPLDGGRLAISDLNILWGRVINRNNRLKRLMQVSAPDIILKNERRMLQDAVDTLLSSSNSLRPAKNSLGRSLKSIADFLKGKQGRFRQNLLGKRVDYSGRSVIVVGPELRLHEFGLPKKMAIELFKPFVISKLCLLKGTSIRGALDMIKVEHPDVWGILEDVISEHPVLLNRAPTLHRLGIQAFEPKLIDSKAIQLHPLVCKAFNADFDGDQMAVYIPLSIESQLEARILMLSSNNIINVANGEIIIVPRKDIVAGLYYMTIEFDGEPGEGMTFCSTDDVLNALDNKIITVNSKIKYRYSYSTNPREFHSSETTPGRIMLYNFIPNDGKLKFEDINMPWSVNSLGEILEKVRSIYNSKTAVIVADQITKVGFRYNTISGLSLGKDDLIVPETKQGHIASALEEIKVTQEQYMSGIITEKEKFNKITDRWFKCTKTISDDMMSQILKNKDNRHINPIYLVMNSGARASETQMRQIAGMKGLVAKPSGEIIETPIISNFKEGLSVFEYFISAHGARKGNVDTALKTADAGYLTRRLVDVAQDCIVTIDDCGTDEYVVYSNNNNDPTSTKEDISKIAIGRTLAEDIMLNGKIALSKGHLFTKSSVSIISENNISEIKLRSVATCHADFGVCAKCYGANIVNDKLIDLGEPVGVIAAQSIGEPGTQLTLRTFHVGGAASKDHTEPFIKAESDCIFNINSDNFIENSNGEKIFVGNTCVVSLVAKNGSLILKQNIGYGSKVLLNNGDSLKAGEKAIEWDPYSSYIFAEKDGEIRFSDLVKRVSYQEIIDEIVGKSNKVIINWLNLDRSLEPKVSLVTSGGDIIKDENGFDIIYKLSPGAVILKNDGDKVKIGDIIARIPKETTGILHDITGGLPRIEEIFEARVPSSPAVIALFDGFIEFGSSSMSKFKIILRSADGSREHVYQVPKEKYTAIRNGSFVRKGDIIFNGNINPQDLLELEGIGPVVSYLTSEIEKVYGLQGVSINKKHIEIILKYMLNKVEILSAGESELKIGQRLSLTEAREINRKLIESKKELTVFRNLIYGITKSSVNTDSFISAASFQETIKVLTDAALEKRKDPLRGMKESMIVGRLIPAGTGFVTLKARKESKI